MKRALRDKFISQEITSILCDLHNNDKTPYPYHSKMLLARNRLAQLNNIILGKNTYGQDEIYNMSNQDLEQLKEYTEKYKKVAQEVE